MTRRAWGAYAIVFLAGGSTLVLEIAAGRLLASYFGVSLYTWTSIIGVILAGISLGNYLGGTVADRAGSGRALGLVLATGGLVSLAILPFTTVELLTLAPSGLPVIVRMVWITALLFLLPSAMLGMVAPLVVKRTLADLTRAGGVVGRIYAWSTLGSIAGVFLTGFVLIPRVGTRAVIFGVGLVAGTLVPRAKTYVVAATRTPLDLERLRAIPWRGPDDETRVGVLPPDALEEWLRGANPVVLTDDYAPADNLMGPIFLERGL